MSLTFVVSYGCVFRKEQLLRPLQSETCLSLSFVGVSLQKTGQGDFIYSFHSVLKRKSCTKRKRKVKDKRENTCFFNNTNIILSFSFVFHFTFICVILVVHSSVCFLSRNLLIIKTFSGFKFLTNNSLPRQETMDNKNLTVALTSGHQFMSNSSSSDVIPATKQGKSMSCYW